MLSEKESRPSLVKKLNTCTVGRPKEKVAFSSYRVAPVSVMILTRNSSSS
ncbi:MAG TPA: hypothetical protein H9796_09155 [Candidatus Butyricimonas faecavium]|nr:hypothetical protein [Candidatus Butyricimonas faecavium]